MRGLIYLAIAILLLIGAAVLLMVLQPAVGEVYAMGPRIAIQVVLVAAWILLLMGLFRGIVGSGVGAGAGILKGIAIVVVCAVGLGALFSTWIIHRVVSSPHTASSSHWDWDD